MGINSNVNEMNKLAEIRKLHAAETEEHEVRYGAAFVEINEMAKLNIMDEPVASEMPDPDMTRAAVEMVIGTIFDVFRDTRMDEFARQLAWGFVNSFHMTARIAERREDDVAKKLGELARSFDPSEIYATELEETQLLCQTLQGCREALEAMRDHASDVYHVETGKPFTSARGSQVSKNGVTGSQIEARDYLAARKKTRDAQMAPNGPVVIVSGGQQWYDYEIIFNRLDSIKKRVPNMVIATTAMRKGVDPIAISWAQKNGVDVIRYTPNSRYGRRAAFVRNEQMMQANPVEAIICEGSGIQLNLLDRVRKANVPVHVIRCNEQKSM